MLAYLDELQKPITNVTVRYKAKGGQVTLKAERVHIVGIDGLVLAQNITLRTEDGLIVARATDAEVLAPVPWGKKPRWDVAVSGLEADIERQSDGKWSFENFLPKRKDDTPSDVVFAVRVKDSRIAIVDKVGSWNNPISTEIESLRVSGAGQSIVAKLKAKIAGIGIVDGDAIANKGNLEFVRITTPGVNVGVIRKILGNFKETRNEDWVNTWDIAAGSFSGKVSWNINSGEIHGFAHADATSVRLGSQRFDAVSFAGEFSEKRLVGDWNVLGNGAKAVAAGEIEFAPKLVVRLNGEMSASSLNSAREYFVGIELPNNLSLSDGFFRGGVQFQDSLTAYGDFSAARLNYSDYQVSKATAQVIVNKDQVRFSKITGDVEGSPIWGEANFETTGDKAVKAFFRAKNVPLSQFPNLPKKFVLGGRIDVTAIISGPMSHANVSFDIAGDARLLLQSELETIVEPVDINARAAFEDGILNVSALEISGASGNARGSGKYNLKTTGLDFRLVANNLRLKALPESPADGTGYADVKVTGTLSKPIAEGKVEVYAGSIGEYSLPFASGFAKYSNDNISISDLTIRSGVSLATGTMNIGLISGAPLSGSGSIVDFGLDFLNDNRFQGLAEGKWSISGSLKDPSGHVELFGSSLFIDKVSAKNTTMELDANRNSVTIKRFTATVGNGLFEASGTYPFSGDGEIRISGTDINPDVFDAYDQSSVAYDGKISLNGSVIFRDSKPLSGNFTTSLQDISVNNVWIGPGKIKADYANNQLHVEGFTSNLDRNFVLENGFYDFESKEIGGTFSAIRADIASLITLSENQISQLTPEQQEQIRKLSGDLSVAVQVDGTFDDSLLKIDVATDRLSFDNKSVGKLVVSANKTGKRWTIPVATWSGGPALISLDPKSDNFVEVDGEISLDGEITNIKLAEFAQFFPATEGLVGSMDIYFNATGTTKSPSIIASISGDKVGTKDFALSSLNFERIEIQDGSISTNSTNKESAKAQLHYKGFNAEISNLVVPFRFPFEFDRNLPISARVDVPSRDIASLSELFGGLDTQVSDGKLNNAVLEVSGSLNSLTVVGNVTANIPKLKFRDFDPIFSISEANFQLLPNEIIDIKVSGSSNQGGDFDLSAKIDIAENSILDGSKISANAFTLQDQIANGVLVGGKISLENLSIGGPLESPIIGGRNSKIIIDNGNLILDGELPSADAPTALVINPVFDIATIDIQSARIKSGSLNTNVEGKGSLKGTLEQPDAQIDFELKSGDVNLPTSRIRLQPGGTAALSFSRNWDGETKAVLEVSLKGSTQVNAFDGLSVQRYRILLNITGDAMSQDGLRIDAESDPPGLTRDEILALIGQLKVLESIAGIGGGNQGGRFEDILTLAAPAIFAPITRGIEAGLGLDYVLLDFGRGGNGSFTIGKTLGLGFTAEYRGPLGDTTREFGNLEQLVLTYRPLSQNLLLRQLSLSAIIEQPGLLSFRFGYSGRF